MHETDRHLSPAGDLVLHLVEQLALRLAEHYQGRITPPHLAAYLPMPLDMIRTCLDAMVDGHTVSTVPGESLVIYEFMAYRSMHVQVGELSLEHCLSCGTELLSGQTEVWCATCVNAVYQQLARPATPAGWITQAAYEHRILYAAAQHQQPLPATTLSSRARLRLRPLQHKLEQLTLEGYLTQEVEAETGTILYAFPPLVYSQERYQANMARLRSWEQRARRGARRKRAVLLGLLGLLTLGSLGYWYTTAVSPSPTSAPARLRPYAQSVPSAPPAQPTPLPSPPYGAAYHEQAMSWAQPVPVSLRQQGFVPVDMHVPYSWNTSTPLSPTPSPGIKKTPAYQGSGQWYGMLKLGTRANPFYHFVFDLVTGPHPVVYFDANQNGDLTDDGAPLTNQGSGIFATRITLPWRRLSAEAPFPGQYQLWFFTNDTLWQRSAVAHYSRTQLRGTVSLAGKTYLAQIADARDNDADLTNDGIYLDINGNGKIDRDGEFFPPQQVARIDGQDYVFVITW
jgi:hypothetical protein